MLGNLAVFHTPQVVVSGGCAAKGALADCQDEVALRQHLMHGGVDHLDALLGKGGKCRTEAGQTVGNAGVVLDVGIAIKVIGGLFRVVALHHIVQEALNQLAVFLGLVRIGDCHRAVGLGVTGGIGRSQRSQVVPVFSNLAAVIETEDIEGNLLTGTGKVIDGLKEYLVAIGKGADVVYRGLHRCAGQIGNGANEGIPSGAVGQIVLDVALCQQAGCGFGIAGGEGVDEFERFLSVCHFGFLLGIVMAAAE